MSAAAGVRLAGLGKLARNPHAIAFSLLMACVVAVFWRFLFTSDVLFFRDITAAHYPRLVELRALVRSGHFPLWNPFEHLGEAVAVNPNYLLFYPTTWLAWLLPPAYGFKLHFVLHFILLAAGSFLLAARARMSAFACFVAGALFVFSGPAMSLGNFMNMAAAVAWMPFVVLAADYQARQRGWRGLGLVAGAVALQFCAGEPANSLATALLALGWVLAAHGSRLRRGWNGANAVLAARLALAGLLGAALSAVQLLPAVLHVFRTERAAHMPRLQSLYWSFHPLRLAEVLFPDFWGNALSMTNVPWIFMDGNTPLLLSVFIGVIPLALAATGAFCHGREPAEGRAFRQFWLAAGIVAMAVALGRFTPLSYLLYDVVPLFRVVRFPVRFVIPVCLAIAQLAALGVDRLLAAAPEDAEPGGETQPPALPWIRRVVAGFGIAWLLLAGAMWLLPQAAARASNAFSAWFFDAELAADVQMWLHTRRTETVTNASAWLLRTIPAAAPYLAGCVALMLLATSFRLRARLRARIVYAVAALAVVQIIASTYHTNPLVDHRFFETPPPVVSYFKPSNPPVRFFAESTTPSPASIPFRAYLPAVAFLPPVAWEMYMYRQSLQYTAGALQMEQAYAEDIEVILPSEQYFVFSLVPKNRVRGDALTRLLRLTSVEYVLLRTAAPPPGCEFVATAANASSTPVQLYRLPASQPRAYVVPSAVQVPAGIETLRTMLGETFEPTRQVVLEPGLAGEEQTPAPRGFRSAARILAREPGRVAIAAEASGPGYLVLTDSFSPDWKAAVDGRPVPVLRANQLFRAVPLPAGSHQVEFRYRSAAVYWGAAITLATLIGLVVLGWWEARRGRART